MRTEAQEGVGLGLLVLGRGGATDVHIGDS